MSKVLIATALGSGFEDFIAKTAKSCLMDVIEETLDVRKFLLDKVEQYSPDIVVMSDQLMSDFSSRQFKERDEELLQIINELRVREIRVIFICMREEGDAFLGELINLQVYDIWYSKTFDIGEFTSRFPNENKKTYKEMQYLRDLAKGFHWKPIIPNDEKDPLTTEGEQSGQSTKKMNREQKLFSGRKFSFGDFQIKDLIPGSSRPPQSPHYIEVTVPQIVHIPNRMVAIVSLYSGAGSTFLTGNLAHLLNHFKVPVGVLEPVGPDPIWFELLYGRKYNPEYQSIASQIQERNWDRKPTWQQDMITWMPIEPGFDPSMWTREDSYILLNTARQFPVLLVDVSTSWKGDMGKLILSMADEIWVVAGSSPSKVSSAIHHLGSILDFENKIFVIANYWNHFIEKKRSSFEKSFGYEDEEYEVSFPLISTISQYGEEVVAAEWEGKFLFEHTKNEQLMQELQPLLKRLVPPSVLESKEPHLESGLSSKIRSLFTRR